MKETLSIETERTDDIPLLLTHMQRMQVAALLDKHFPTHGLRKGLSMGELTQVWLVHVLSQADHRMNHVQEWASRRLTTLRGCGLESLTPLDMTDDRLADVLRLLADDERYRAFEQELDGTAVAGLCSGCKLCAAGHDYGEQLHRCERRGVAAIGTFQRSSTGPASGQNCPGYSGPVWGSAGQ